MRTTPRTARERNDVSTVRVPRPAGAPPASTRVGARRSSSQSRERRTEPSVRTPRAAFTVA